MTISFEETDEGAGFTVFDPIERHHLEVNTSSPVSVSPADPGDFYFPVDDAVTFRTGHLELPSTSGLIVHGPEGEMLKNVSQFGADTFPHGTYSLGLWAPIKIYIRVTSSLDVHLDESRYLVEFDGDVEVTFGARSLHESPAGTVTTTDDPRDVMSAVSTLGSALKVTTPERSYPTLRGHPPLIERSDECSVPDDIERPDTGVRIEVPERLGHVYVVSPLAYYLGAEVVPGDSPRLVTDAGFDYDLAGPLGFETTVERTLKQVFLLDCVTRTEGLYDIPLRERSAVEPHLNVDLADLYEMPLAEQLEWYLSVPYETVETHVPTWKLTSHVAPTSDAVECLPFLVEDLAVVRTPEDVPTADTTQTAEVVEEFVRNGALTRSTAGESASVPGEMVEPVETDSLEQAWIGDGAPVGASKVTEQAFQNRLARTPSEGDISISVVCNDEEMTEEHDFVREVYGDRDRLPFDVTVRRNLDVAELRELLARHGEFFHYIGHIDEDGFACADGRLDAQTLETVGVEAFFLNACTSYRQGLGLVEAGSIGGVVTRWDVINSGAVRVGCTFARLLNTGFPLNPALDIASEESLVGNQYNVVGDGGLSIAQTPSGTATYFELEEIEGGSYELHWYDYPTRDANLGTSVNPNFEDVSDSFLGSGRIGTFEVESDELVPLFQPVSFPVRIGSELYWTDELDLDAL